MDEDLKSTLTGCAGVAAVAILILWVLVVEIAKGVAWIRWAFA
ncbi:MAG: hypothetical protein RLZZ387_2581 [Chloroflexota bacterium]|jgi:hypothetical protein